MPQPHHLQADPDEFPVSEDSEEDFDLGTKKPPSWHERLLVNDKGAPRALLANAMTAIEEAPEWRNLIAYNEFAATSGWIGIPPWEPADFQPRDFRDTDFSHAARWMQNQGIAVTSTVAAEAMVAIAAKHQFHPVKAYLSSLLWDGKPRAATWLSDHLGVEPSALNEAFAIKFLVGAVARIMQPGCKLDTLLVLEGRQSLRKSAALECMGGGYYSNDIPDLHAKDAMQHLQGRWLVEFAEFDTLGKADVPRAKAFISTARDRFRPPYGKMTLDFPRQCVFAATVNPGAVGYLKDETGNRRYWPVTCGDGWSNDRKIDTKALADVRDQLWAEAAHQHNAGMTWWLDQHDYEVSQAETARDREVEDPWTEKVFDWLDDPRPWPIGHNNPGPINDVTISQIMVGIDLDMSQQHNGANTRIGTILTKAGWSRTRHRVGGQPVVPGKKPPRSYHRPT